MRDGRPKKNSARAMTETSNLPAPLVVVDDVGVTITVVTMTTVLLASCGVVGDGELTTSGVVDVVVDEVVDEVVDVEVGEVVDVDVEVVVDVDVEVDVEVVVGEVLLDWVVVDEVVDEVLVVVVVVVVFESVGRKKVSQIRVQGNLRWKEETDRQNTFGSGLSELKTEKVDGMQELNIE
jgi:hypothetical protein